MDSLSELPNDLSNGTISDRLPLHNTPTSQTDRQTAACNGNTARCTKVLCMINSKKSVDHTS